MARRSDAGYSVHPSVAYARSILENLPARTGRSLDEWIALLVEDGPPETGARRAWLKTRHGLGATTVSLIVDRAEGRGAEGTEPRAYLAAARGYVEAMYAGARSGLRPIHDLLVEEARSLGSDVKICPCQTIVPLYRRHVFAQLKPATRTRLDLGLALEGAKRKPPKRLIETGGLAKGDRITHRIALAAAGEVDDQVREWLGLAYALDA